MYVYNAKTINRLQEYSIWNSINTGECLQTPTSYRPKRNGARMYWRSSFAFPRLRSKSHGVYEAVQLDATDIYRQILLTSAERILHFTSYLSLWSRCLSTVNSGSSSHHVVVGGGGDDVLLPLIALQPEQVHTSVKKFSFLSIGFRQVQATVYRFSNV
jgi:hypothetical protein